MSSTPAAAAVPDCEYIVVGSGAGGGTVAARLAESGKHVILLEAGGDPRSLIGGDPIQSEANRLPYDYDVPAFHAFASENSALAWRFFVRHYADDKRQRLDRNFTETDEGSRVDGIYYPRAGTLGGCTAHNAMIFVYPHNADWDDIASLTGDASWSSANMRTYFQRIEHCRHRQLQRWLSKVGFDRTRHGWKGWLSTEAAIPKEAMGDRQLDRALAESAFEAFREDGHQIDRVRWFLQGWLDPNDWRLVGKNATGIRYLPLTTYDHVRRGTRERLLDVAARFPHRLRIVMHAHATKVVLDRNRRAIGVEFLQGERLYRAYLNPSSRQGERCAVYCSREVILAGGTFNTPQLLMLSGIGPAEELRRHEIAVELDLPGVGSNLQDRYEIGVVNRMRMPAWRVFDGAAFDSHDRQFAEWAASRGGIYATNGAVLTLFRRSSPNVPLPDLFCMALLANFTGYHPRYCRKFAEDLNALTWVVLKAHTRNRAGTVKLRSSDPLEPPVIDFNYFAEGGDEDLNALVEGVRFVRRVTRKLGSLVVREEVPGENLRDEELTEFVRLNAWGHHACGTCPIGPPGSRAVLSGDFRVHGTERLRVVDASVFPRIPGFFIVCSVYMIGEKAADAILRDAQCG